MMKLVSPCLIGVKCDHEGCNKLNQKVYEEFKKGDMYPICPEILGGLPVPRAPAEIVYGTGIDVISGRARVINLNCNNVTRHYVDGAFKTLEIAKKLKAKEAILKSKSPSCGCGKVFNGEFSQTLVDGDGVTTALLKKHGIRVYTEDYFK